MNYSEMLAVAFEEALLGFNEGGVPVGAALFDANAKLLSRGRNRRVQDKTPFIFTKSSSHFIHL